MKVEKWKINVELSWYILNTRYGAEPKQSNSGQGFDFDATSLAKKQDPGKAKDSR